MTDDKVPELISLDIAASGSGRFKSIQNLSWQNIPRFAILTGRNGAGKSQLLELLAYRLTDTLHPQLGNISFMNLNIIGENYTPDDVAYVPVSGDFAHAAILTVAGMQTAKQQLYQQIINTGQLQRDMYLRAKRLRVEKLLGTNIESIPADQFIRRLPDDFVFMLEDKDVITGLAHVILGYRLQAVQELEKQTPEPEIRRKLGPPPWDVLNEVLGVAGFSYHVVSPLGSSLLEPFDFRLADQNTGVAIQPGDLSSGEKVLLRQVLWLYNSKHHNRFPRLMLLDEPDAHLHPSMARQFMDVVQEVLVGRYNIRVIMTTHSPSTVALAPEESLFEMNRGEATIHPSKSKSDTIGLLTAGIVVVSSTTRFVLVEDDDDVNFYGVIRDILSDYGPSKDLMALSPTPTIAFLPSSSGKGVNKIGGGKGAVAEWVKKLDAPPFDQVIRGLVDGDSGNLAADRIYVLGRYSIENYLLDPFTVFGLLLENGSAPTLSGISISSGDEHLIRGLDDAKLQQIVDHIGSTVQPFVPNLMPAEKLRQAVEFTNGQKVNYFNWMITRRGHDLMPIFQGVFGGPRLISPPRLTKALQRVRLVPKELAMLIAKLQQA